MPMLYDPAYMDRRSIMFMRSWLENSIGDVGQVAPIYLNHAYKLIWAGIIEGVDDDGSVTITELGMYVVDKLAAQSFNFFPLWQVMDIWPIEWIEAASARSHQLREAPSEHTVINFMSVFQLEFPLDESVKSYVRDRIRANADGRKWAASPYTGKLPPQLVDWPERSVDFTVASDAAGDFAADVRELSVGDLSAYLKTHREARGGGEAEDDADFGPDDVEELEPDFGFEEDAPATDDDGFSF
jgi:hypothetical protein